MRAGLAIAIFLVGTAAASAADMPLSPGGGGGYSHYYSGGGVRAGQITIYDSEPGVVARAYWRSPWRGRHYFPTNGEQPVRGRHEDLSSNGPLPEAGGDVPALLVDDAELSGRTGTWMRVPSTSHCHPKNGSRNNAANYLTARTGA